MFTPVISPDGNFKARCFDPDGRVWEEKGRASHRFCRDFAGSDFDSGRSGRVAGEIDIKRAEAAQKRAEERLQAHSSDTDMARAETALLPSRCKN